MQQYSTVATTLMKILKQAGIEIMNVRTWNQVFHIGYMQNPFDELVEQTYVNTRSKYTLKCVNKANKDTREAENHNNKVSVLELSQSILQ